MRRATPPSPPLKILLSTSPLCPTCQISPPQAQPFSSHCPPTRPARTTTTRRVSIGIGGHANIISPNTRFTFSQHSPESLAHPAKQQYFDEELCPLLSSPAAWDSESEFRYSAVMKPRGASGGIKREDLGRMGGREEGIGASAAERYLGCVRGFLTRNR